MSFACRVGVDQSKLINDQFKYFDAGLNNVDCMHLFNGVSYSKIPWVVTFETLLPRFRVALTERNKNGEIVKKDREVVNALERLASTRCRSVIAISESAYSIQREFLGLFPEIKSEILKKMEVIHPPQKALVELGDIQLSRSQSKPQPLRFLLIGHQFFSKGGREVLSALSEVRRHSGVDVRLTVISKLTPDQYVTFTGSRDRLKVLEYFRRNADWITHHSALPYGKVLDTIRHSDVGLLPSLAETYGYSVLELQASGRPVITTDVRAFPEINNDDCGWVIPVRKRATGGEAFYESLDERSRLSTDIERGLKHALEEIVGDRDVVAIKGMRSVARIRAEHDPGAYGMKLSSIYEKARSSWAPQS